MKERNALTLGRVFVQLYFLESLPKSVQYTLTPGTEDAHRYNFSTNGVVIELTHNKGDEHKDEATVYPGNGPKEDDAFGHLAISTEDVYEASRMLEEDYKVTFKKRPNEGKMSGIAFFSDPDGYSIEIVEREKGYQDMPTFGIAQTMIRTKRLNDTINFFQNHFNMTLVRKAGIPGDFVNAFMATVPQSLKDEMPQDIEDRESAKAFVAKLYSNLIPVLELTHNEGVDQLDFEYHSGNENEPDGTLRKGFGHVGFLVPDVYETCKELKDAGCSFQKEPEGGSMKGLAFAKSPDGIWYAVQVNLLIN